jgi:hypothetical protein
LRICGKPFDAVDGLNRYTLVEIVRNVILSPAQTVPTRHNYELNVTRYRRLYLEYCENWVLLGYFKHSLPP